MENQGGTMTSAQKEKAALFADAASVADPANLSPGQRLLLQEKAEKLFWPAPDVNNLLTYARTWLLPLVGGALVRPDVQPTWTVRNGELAVGIAISEPGLAFLSDLIRVIYLTPFPFKQCPVCHRVFVSQNTKKRYCSGNCAYRGIEDARKESRRPKAKERMRKRRALEKGLAEAKKKALARSRAGKHPAGEKAFAEDLTSLPPSPWKTDEERKTYQAAEQQRLREILEKKRHTKAPRGRKEQ
jgi:hypothetical protein